MNNYPAPGHPMQPLATGPPLPYDSQYHPVPHKHEQQLLEEKGILKEAAERWKKRVKQLRMLSRAISTILNAAMFAFMAFVIATFIATRHDEALGRNIWPKVTKTWPTYMLLASSLVTFLMSVVVLCFYCLCFKRASESWKLVVLNYGVHIGVWLVVTTLYRTEKVTNDLWGWSCTQIATDLQQKGHSRVNFQDLCKIQVHSVIIILGNS